MYTYTGKGLYCRRVANDVACGCGLNRHRDTGFGAVGFTFLDLLRTTETYF
jgi:hypothetical protein